MFYLVYPAAKIDEWYPYLAEKQGDLAVNIQCIPTSSRLFRRMKEEVSIIDVLSTDRLYHREADEISGKMSNYVRNDDMKMIAAWIDRDVRDNTPLSMFTLRPLAIAACVNEYISPSSIGIIARLMRRHIYDRKDDTSPLQRLSGCLYISSAKNIHIFLDALVGDDDEEDPLGRQDNRDKLITYIFREMRNSYRMTTTLIDWIAKKKKEAASSFIVDKIYPLMRDIDTVSVGALHILDDAGVPFSALTVNDTSTTAMLVDSLVGGHECVDRVMRAVGDRLDMSKHLGALTGSREYIYAIFASEAIRRRGWMDTSTDTPSGLHDIPTNSSLLMSAVMCNIRFGNTPRERRRGKERYSCHLFIEHCVRAGLWVGSLDPRDYRAFISEVRVGMSSSDKAFVTRIIAERYMGAALVSAVGMSDVTIVVDE